MLSYHYKILQCKESTFVFVVNASAICTLLMFIFIMRARLCYRTSMLLIKLQAKSMKAATLCITWLVSVHIECDNMT